MPTRAVAKFLFNLICLPGLLLIASSAFANIPGGGTGTGPDVTLTDNGTTVTMANGIVSIVCIKSSAVLSQVSYAYNNSGVMVTNQLLSGGKDGGEFYWETGGFGSGTFTESVVANNGNYCEIDLLSTSATNGTMDVHFSMLRGSTGFYVTATWSHRAGDGVFGMGETRDNIYLNPEFTWNTIDAAHNFQYNLGGAGGGGTGGAVGVQGAPVEVSLWTNGIAQGRYEDKYKYCADFGTERVWGWSSVNNPAAGFTGQNIGIWHILASSEYYNGGPMKPELMDAPMVNMLNGGHYYLGNDSEYGANEVWTRVQGPYFIYCNNVTNTYTQPFQTAEALYTNALAQGVAEQSAWPYYWFTNASYAPASQRGAVSGQFVIADSGNPNASASNLWVGVVQQPVSVNGVYDFQIYMKPYQFWVKTDASGNFTIPNVIAGNNYTLWAFGPGINGTFMSQSQSGNYPPLLYSLPASPFGVTVAGGATNNLGIVTWTNSARVGATVFEIGYPDRTAKKFRHGDDWWVGDIGPNPTNPVPVWSKFLEYPFDFPNGLNYVVGQSRWSTDWNFIQPNVVDSQGNMNGSISTITFNLAQAPTNGAMASLYIALCSDDAGPLEINVNGGNSLVSGSGGVTATPVALPSTGYFPLTINSADSIGYSQSDTSIREGINAAFSDERIGFPGSLLQVGQNTITINMRKGGSLDNHAMYDYIRLELTGYVPPPPASVAAYAGNNCNLISWPVTPGATSYNILSSTTSGSNYILVASGVTGPVCGSGPNNATYLDTNAINGTTYYYVVQSVNPVNASTNSPESPGATPSASLSTSLPAAPTGLSVSSVGHQSVTLNWTASPGANFYTIQRSTLVDTLGSASNTLSTIILNNSTTSTSYIDTSPTDGSIYSYSVTATSVGGTSGNSASAVAVPVPAPPAGVPGSLTGHPAQSTNVSLSWSAVSGAVGYIIRGSASPGGPFNYLMSITETTYTNVGQGYGTTNYYQVSAVNAGGVSGSSSVTVITPPPAPANLGATPGNTQILLNWTTSGTATNYVLMRGLTSNTVNTVVATITGTSYIDTNLVNGTTYYYTVSANGSGGSGPNSPQAHAAPSSATINGLVWIGGTSSTWDTTTTNWLLNGITTTAYADGNGVTFNDSAASISVTTAGTVLPSSVTFANATAGYTMTGVGNGISGSTSVVKTNAVNVTMAGTHTYSGGTVVNAGRLTFNVGTAIPASGTLMLNNTGAVTVVTANGLPNVLVNGTNAITGQGNSGTGVATLDVEGTLTLFVSGGSKVFDLTGTMTGPGNLILGTSGMSLRFNGTAGDGSAIFNLGTGANFASVRNTAAAIALGGLAGGSTTQLQGNNSSAINTTYTIGGANANTEFDGLIKDGTASTVALVKTGTGTFTLTNANIYSGGTTINGGLLQVNSLGGSGTGSGAITVASGGTLGGKGIILGAVTVNSNGALAPGSNFIGTLTISNNLTLAAGSTTFMQVQGHLTGPVTNNAAKISGTLLEGGTLNVTSIGGIFVNGDSFKLFSATNYSGAFAGFVLPPLTGNLVWNTNLLKTSGTLAVASYAPPVIGKPAITGAGLNVSGTGGIAGWTYYVLTATNLAAPQWTVKATNQFDTGGNFNFTNAIDPTQPQTFYKLQLQ